MGQKKFFVNVNNQMAGPWTIHEIIEKVNSSELKATDYLYVEASDDWVLICSHPDFLEAHKNNKPNPMKNQTPPELKGLPTDIPKAPLTERAQTNTPTPEVKAVETEKTNTATKPNTDEWYVLKGKNRYGPFPYLDLLRMLQEKSVFEFDYVWRSDMENWKRIAELNQFSADAIRTHLEKEETDMEQIFFRRRHERTDYECPLILHDNNRVWQGRIVQISEGGAGVIMNNAMMMPGQNVYLHFKPGPKSKPFNALCEIVSKRYIKGVKDKDTPLLYGIKFINIHKADKEVLKSLTTNAA